MPVIKKRKRHTSAGPIQKKARKASMLLPVNISRMVERKLNQKIETKTSCQTSSDGAQIFNNDFITRSSNLLATSLGNLDPSLGAVQNRIGDSISLSGISIKIMLELNERYSMGTFRLFVVKCARGDTPTKSTLFSGLSANKMIDTINTERYSILVSKTVVIRQSSTGIKPDLIQTSGSGYATGTPLISRATKIVSMYIPGKKFAKNGHIVYDNGGSQAKFFDYHFLVYSYANHDADGSFYVGRVNDEVIRMFYKDA